MTFRAKPRFILILAGALLSAIGGCSAPEPGLPQIERANQALLAGDGLGAEVILRQMLSAGVPLDELAAYLGEAELQQGRTKEAREWLHSKQFSSDTRGRGFWMLGRLEMADGHLPEAGKAFDEALKSKPDDPGLWVDIGRLRYLGGEQLQAVEASVQAVKFGPTDPLALQFRAQLVRDAEGMSAVLPLYRDALQSNPDNLALLGDYAAALGELGYAREMLVAVRHMTTIDDRNPRAYYLQAVLAARAGNFGLAQDLLTKGSAFARNLPAAILLSAIIDMELGNYASSSQTLDRLNRMQPDNAKVRVLLARSLALGGNHRELVYRFASTAKAVGAAPYLATLVGRSYEALGQREKAARFLDFAAGPRNGSLTPLPSPIPLDVAQLHGTQTGSDTVALVRGLIIAEQPDIAISAAEIFRHRLPGSADAMGLAGDAYLNGGQPARANELYRQSAQVRRPWLLARRMVAAEKASGRFDEALKVLEAQLASDPANTEAATLLAQAALSSGDADSGEIYLDHALANGAGRDPHVLAMRAQIALQGGNSAEALGFASKAYVLQRMNREATRVLLQVLTKLGSDPQRAAQLNRKLAKLPTGS